MFVDMKFCLAGIIPSEPEISLTWYQGVKTEAGDLAVLLHAEKEAASLGVPDLHLLVLAAGHHPAAVSSEGQTGDPATVT